MTRGRYKILVVEPDAQIVDIIVESLSHALRARLTCVAGAMDALDVEMLEPHDAVICEWALPDMNGLEAAERLLELSTRPVIMIGTDPGTRRVIEAMRLGVTDCFIKPFPVARLLDAVRAAAHAHRTNVRHRARTQRTRDVLREALRRRRDLRRRVDLICRDLVHAHRQLVDRVVEFESVRGANT